MLRVRVAVLVLTGAFLGLAPFAQAASKADLTLSNIRAVRISTTSLTLSFKTSESAIGQVTYTQTDSSSLQLTDSEPQTDHLFTMTELDPKHGYSFTLTATTDTADSNSYVVLLSPETVGAPGQSIVPPVQVLSASGDVITSLPSASSTSPHSKTILPWWVFLLLFLLVVGGWIANILYKRRHPQTVF